MCVPAAGRTQRTRIIANTAELEPLEVLRQENELLKSTISETQAAIADLEQGLAAAGGS